MCNRRPVMCVRPPGVSDCMSTGGAESMRRCRRQVSALGTQRGSSPWQPQPASLWALKPATLKPRQRGCLFCF